MKVLVVGGRGFLGRAVCKELKDLDVYTMDRKQGGKKHLKCPLSNYEKLKKLLPDFDVVVNLVGLSPLKEPKGTSYSEVHVRGVRNILFCLKQRQRYVHISALGANKDSEIEFLRTKGKAEFLIENSKIKHTIIRPSFIFDSGNEFFGQLDKTKYFLFFPNIPTKMQPVYRGDVAKVVRQSVLGKVKKKVLEIGGPHKMSLYNMAYAYREARGEVCLKFPYSLFKAGFWLVSRTGLQGLGKDQFKISMVNNTCKRSDLKDYVSRPKSYYEWVEEA